jgi:hypothetical protein
MNYRAVVACVTISYFCVACGGKSLTISQGIIGGIDLTSGIEVAESTPYLDETIVPVKIRKECTNLGRELSEATQRYGTKYGVKFIRKTEIEPSKGGQVLVLKIASAVSSGNAWIGHDKYINVKIELYKDGKLLASDMKERNSRGGFGAGFKSSCSVLGRCVNTLGSDIAKWVKEYRAQ